MQGFMHDHGARLRIDDASIYYEASGEADAPPLVLLHGGLGNIEDFNGLLAGLTGRFRFIGIDSRGQGASSLGTSPLSYERLQQDVERVLAHLGLHRFSLLGFSDGGIVGYRIAASGKFDISGLVTIGAHGMLADDDPVRILYRKVTGESWRQKFPAMYDAYQRLNPEPDFDALVNAIRSMWLDSSSHGYPGDSVKDIACPVLIARGDEDHLVTLESLVELRALIRNSRLLNLPFAGHVAFDDQRDVFLATLDRFFEDCA